MNNLIKIHIKEKLEGDYVKYEKIITFLGISIYKYTSYTGNIDVINQFKKYKRKIVKGFNNEN